MSARSSKLLIDEEPLQVIPSLAAKIGLNRAMFIQQLHYWLRKSSAHVRDDERWIYNSFEDWHEQFPFWSPEAIRKIASQLQQKGLIKTTSRYNKRKGDRTLWYSINYDALNALFDQPDDSTEPPDQPDKSTEQPDKSTEQPDKSTERYQRRTTETTTEIPVGASNDAAPAKSDTFVSYLAEELGGADVPLLGGRKARYGKEFKVHLDKGVEAALLYKCADRIIERWKGDDHRKLLVEQAYEDVVNGKPPAGVASSNGKSRSGDDRPENPYSLESYLDWKDTKRMTKEAS